MFHIFKYYWPSASGYNDLWIRKLWFVIIAPLRNRCFSLDGKETNLSSRYTLKNKISTEETERNKENKKEEIKKITKGKEENKEEEKNWIMFIDTRKTKVDNEVEKRENDDENHLNEEAENLEKEKKEEEKRITDEVDEDNNKAEVKFSTISPLTLEVKSSTISPLTPEVKSSTISPLTPEEWLSRLFFLENLFLD